MSLSACVTRILSLHGFPPELKTRDIQAAFAEYENDRGGFKIKWIDDTSLLIVFNDAAVAKKAYLNTLVNPPPQFTSPTSESTAFLRPYDGPDAQNVIAAVNSRANGHRARPSISASSGNVMASLGQSGTSPSGLSGPSLGTSSNGHARSSSRGWKKPINVDPNYSLNGPSPVPVPSTSPLAREPSPSLPNLPSHPTLGSLISSSLNDISPHDTSIPS
ncbi:hypothetical protein CPB86DRAFT_706101 [Serendipita vermifera]|nr:hypothetical protein CPB86DRAFT_706101 [Serendipita vermifera]